MLPAAHRLTSPADFREVVRRGRRRGRPTLVLHALAPRESAGAEPELGPVTAGFVVSKAVGGAVVRNRVKRRLRHLVADRIAEVPAGTRLVVRALPPSATTPAAGLAADLDRALATVLDRPVAS